MHYLVTPVEDILLYEHYIMENKCLPAGLGRLPLFQRAFPGSPLERCLAFMLAPPEDLDGWLIFCADFFELRADPLPLLEAAERSALYGVMGWRRGKNLCGARFCEYLGRIAVEEKEQGAGPARARTHRLLGAACAPGAAAEALSGPCLCLHSFLLPSLRELAADLVRSSKAAQAAQAPRQMLDFTDFCLRAAQAGIASRVLPLECFSHLPLILRGPDTDTEAGLERILPEERVLRAAEDIYRHPVCAAEVNLPAVEAARRMQRESRVLDVGCAYGDNGLYFLSALDSVVWGLEYDRAALEHARGRQVYQEVLQADLDNWRPAEFSRFYRFFTHIFMGDVLEHLRSPLSALCACKEMLAPGGSLLVSLPNARHSYVSANLLAGEFNYLPSGILDSTHLRFFTASSQAALFAEAGLEIEEASACFMIPTLEAWSFRIPLDLPPALYDYMLHDRHFLVQQYVCALIPSALAGEELLRLNLERVERAPYNNPEGWAAKEPIFQEFKLRLELALGRTPEDFAEGLRRAAEQGNAQNTLLYSRLCDPAWYKEQYPEAAAGELSPLEHYLSTGWKEGKNPGPAFDTLYYLRSAPGARESGQCPLLHYLANLPGADSFRLPLRPERREQEEAAYARALLQERSPGSPGSPGLREAPASAPPRPQDVKLIAFYLPQFHPIPLNDRRRGRGFTEWDNVAGALPLYAGHYQPHLPVDMGFYDLRLPETAERQAELAKRHGIHGFCYYYYWFDGIKLLDLPLQRLLESGRPDFPFCLAWANEPWLALWDGEDGGLMLNQRRKINVARLCKDLLPLFQDPRYIKVQGRPLFIVYHPEFHGKENFAPAMRELAALMEAQGRPAPYLAFMRHSPAPSFSPADFGGEALLEFPPRSLTQYALGGKHFIHPRFKGRTLDLRASVAHYMSLPPPESLTYRCVMPGWDNSPRRAESGCYIYEHSSPELYLDWLRFCIKQTREEKPPEHRLVFINAWNEWGEGAHLEPDRKYGYAYLQATRAALETTEGT